MAMSTTSITAAGIVACLLLLQLPAPIQAAPIWNFGSIAERYQTYTEDIVAVSDALRANATRAADFAGAKMIYEDSAKAVFSKNYSGLPTYTRNAAYYKKPNPLAASIEAALGNAALCCGSRAGIINSLMRAWPLYWSFIELDAAAAEAAKAKPNKQTIQTATDEAVALWYGNGTRQSPFGTAEAYAVRRCTNSSRMAGVNSTNNALFLEGAKAFKAAALKKDKAAMGRAYNKMSVAATAVFVQNFLYNFDEAVTPPDGYVAAAPVCLAACGQSVAEGVSQGKKVTAGAFWYVMAPTLSTKAPTEVRAVQAVLGSPRRLDMNAGRAVVAQARAAATKYGIDWTKQVDGCPKA